MNTLSHQGHFRSVGKISIIDITSFNGHPVIGESLAGLLIERFPELII